MTPHRTSGKSGAATTRRSIVVGAGASLLLRIAPLRADPDEMREAMRAALGNAPLREGRISLDIPALVENGNSVPLTISVDSPMTAADHVRAIHIFSPENPLPNISRFALGPRCGKAEIKTTIRLATTQLLHVVAVMNDGECFLATAEVEVTTAACFDPT
jgi:sulfur-oxidizing protein SoxY